MEPCETLYHRAEIGGGENWVGIRGSRQAGGGMTGHIIAGRVETYILLYTTTLPPTGIVTN